MLAFDELKYDRKNPIDVCDSVNPVWSEVAFVAWWTQCPQVCQAQTELSAVDFALRLSQ